MIKWVRVWLAIVLFSSLFGCASTAVNQENYDAPDPKAAQINMQLGLSYLERGDYKIALEKLEKSLRQNPNLPSAHNTIALLYQHLGETEKAEKHFKRAVELAPNYSEAQNNFGVFLCDQKQYDKAEQRFLTAVKNPLYKSKAEAYENAGLCALRASKNDKAETYFRKALQLQPRLSKSLISMADISFKNGKYLQARGYEQRYAAVAKWTPAALLLAIKTENKLNDQDAVSSYILLLRGNFPDSDEMQQVNKGQY